MSNTRSRNVPPRADAMIESLRGLGYDTATALADIVDNCITAQSSKIEIHFDWNKGTPWVQIRDNGHGMNELELEAAMRLGGKSPTDRRSEFDLGRFGLGLKTASFSQARRLTVASKRAYVKSECFRWDLDLLSQNGDSGWYLYEGPELGSEEKIGEFLDKEHGTIVLWENLDRMVPLGYKVDDFLNLIDHVELHLSMTFHRFLDAEKKFEILINNKSLRGWDPFLSGHPSKPWSPMELKLPSTEDVIVQCHVLPHKDYLKKDEVISASGPAGWVMQEGFYIYRNRRLLVAGGWLGLGTGRPWVPDEAHRLARIRVDISNKVDTDWKIDIRKSRASPPLAIRALLTRIALETRERARAVFAYRGQYQPIAQESKVVETWVAEKNTKGTRYKISRDHELIQSLYTEAPHCADSIDRILKLIEVTVPVQKIWLDTADDGEAPQNGIGNTPSKEVGEIARELYITYQDKLGLTSEQAKIRLRNTSPFHLYPELITEL